MTFGGPPGSVDSLPILGVLLLVCSVAACGGTEALAPPATPPPPPPPPPPVPVAIVEVFLGKALIESGETTQATAVTKDANGTVLTGRPVTWESASPAIATVNGAGVVTGLSQGVAAIRGVSAQVVGQAAVTVVSPVVTVVVVVPAVGSVMVGRTLTLTATARSAAGQPLSRQIQWQSSAPGIATVAPTGVVTAIAIGQATISATTESVTGSAAITVTPFAFGTGTRTVGTEIRPATYRSIIAAGESCYWERLRGFGGTLAEIIANDNARGRAVVAILGTDVGFRSDSDCGQWIEVVGPVLGAGRVSAASAFGEGAFLVGGEVASGTWRSVGANCYWERLRGWSGELKDIIAYDFGSDPAIVTIAPTDLGFRSERCGSWVKQ